MRKKAHFFRGRGVSGGGLDADPQAFITAANITDPTQQLSIINLVDDLITYGLWDKIKAIYPMVGGTEFSHKFNLKDPRDLDTAFRIVFYGGITHSINGVLPNGSTGYADTFFIPTLDYSSMNNAHLSYYSRTDQLAGEHAEIGAKTANEYEVIVASKFTGNNFYPIIGGKQYPNYNVATSMGYFLANKASFGLINGYINSNKVIDNQQQLGQIPNNSIYLFASNSLSGAYRYSNKECAFATIGDGLTDLDAINLYNSIQSFQTTLGRQV